ncbi:MAG: DUF4920 domain-containing protein [Bacteroidetes bacterium]|nr:DUF4920 domain-containing protein [Bacteroidota bacterium]MDF1867157.1 DUF4920 domain-containing protein [Saprospiraceae bacterium]
MVKRIFMFLAVIAVATACNNAPTPSENMDPTEPLSFGDKITQDGAIGYDDMLTQLAGKEELNAKVTGKVESVCQVKGCWIVVQSDQEGQPEMMVKFKDYGFFMPKDIAGRTVVMEGNAYKEVTPVDELRHYAEDEGKSKEEIEAITEPEEQLKFMASGVLLMPKEGVN